MKHLFLYMTLIIISFRASLNWDNQENFRVRNETLPNGTVIYKHTSIHLNYYDGKECITPFECWSSGCCIDGECKEASECEDKNLEIYKTFLIIGVVLILLIFLYAAASIREAKKNINMMASFGEMNNNKSVKPSNIGKEDPYKNGIRPDQ